MKDPHLQNRQWSRLRLSTLSSRICKSSATNHLKIFQVQFLYNLGFFSHFSKSFKSSPSFRLELNYKWNGLERLSALFHEGAHCSHFQTASSFRLDNTCFRRFSTLASAFTIHTSVLLGLIARSRSRALVLCSCFMVGGVLLHQSMLNLMRAAPSIKPNISSHSRRGNVEGVGGSL